MGGVGDGRSKEGVGDRPDVDGGLLAGWMGNGVSFGLGLDVGQVSEVFEGLEGIDDIVEMVYTSVAGLITPGDFALQLQ